MFVNDNSRRVVQVHVNSKNNPGPVTATRYTKFSFTIPSSWSVSKINLDYVGMPYIWNNVDLTRNRFDCTIGAVTHQISLTSGMYNPISLATSIETLLNAAFSVSDFSVEFDDITKNFRFTNTANDFTIDTTVANNCADIIGLNSAVKTSTAHILIGDKPCNLSPDDEIYVKSTVIGKNYENDFYIPGKSALDTNIIAVVKNTANAGEYISVDSLLLYPIKVSNLSTTIDIQLTLPENIAIEIDGACILKFSFFLNN